MGDDARTKAAKLAQGHDSNPPRCAICCYFRREPHTLFVERKSRSGRTVKSRLKPHPTRNPLVDRCSFGNFVVKPHHVCDRWHGHDGARIEGVSDD